MAKKFPSKPFKNMFRGVNTLKKDKMHRPEGAGNFDNMDDYNIVASMNTKQGTIQHTPANDKDIVNKEYVVDYAAELVHTHAHSATTGQTVDDHHDEDHALNSHTQGSNKVFMTKGTEFKEISLGAAGTFLESGGDGEDMTWGQPDHDNLGNLAWGDAGHTTFDMTTTEYAYPTRQYGVVYTNSSDFTMEVHTSFISSCSELNDTAYAVGYTDAANPPTTVVSLEGQFQYHISTTTINAVIPGIAQAQILVHHMCFIVRPGDRYAITPVAGGSGPGSVTQFSWRETLHGE